MCPPSLSANLSGRRRLRVLAQRNEQPQVSRANVMMAAGGTTQKGKHERERCSGKIKKHRQQQGFFKWSWPTSGRVKEMGGHAHVSLVTQVLPRVKVAKQLPSQRKHLSFSPPTSYLKIYLQRCKEAKMYIKIYAPGHSSLLM